MLFFVPDIAYFRSYLYKCPWRAINANNGNLILEKPRKVVRIRELKYLAKEDYSPSAAECKAARARAAIPFARSREKFPLRRARARARVRYLTIGRARAIITVHWIV